MVIDVTRPRDVLLVCNAVILTLQDLNAASTDKLIFAPVKAGRRARASNIGDTDTAQFTFTWRCARLLFFVCLKRRVRV